MNDNTETTQSARPGSLLVIFLTVFIDLLGFGMVLPLLPVYADHFSSDTSGLEVGLLMASFSAMQFIFAPLWGGLSDRIGRRPVIMIGLAGSAVFYFLFGLATVWDSMALIFVSRIGAGIAGATIPTAQAYIADTTTAEKRTHGMALVGIAFGLGFTFGPVIGYFALTGVEGNLSPLPGYLASGLSALALVLAIFKLPESKTAESESASRKWIDFEAVKVATHKIEIGFVLLSLFVYVFSFAMFETTLSLLIKDEPFDYSNKQICLFYALIGLSLALIQGGIVRRISKRFEDYQLAQTGAAIKVFGLVLVAFAVYAISEYSLYFSMLVIVTGFSFLHPSINAMLSKSVSKEHYGITMGLGQSANSLARIFGSFLGILFLKQEKMLPYLLGAGLMVIGFFLIRLAASKMQNQNIHR